jgi:hypothetical protein
MGVDMRRREIARVWLVVVEKAFCYIKMGVWMGTWRGNSY